MRETGWHIAIILLVTGTVFFTNLGTARLWDRDEPRNAGCAVEMMARGDWVVPLFNDELRHQKPVLLYWLIMSAYSLFGITEFSARFWSAALAVGTTFATYAIARRLLNSTIALYAALALATSLMFDVAARAATPDSALTFFGTAALMTYVLGTFVKSEHGLGLRTPGRWFPGNVIVVIVIYALLGLGALAKGPVGFLLPMAMIGLFLLIQTNPRRSSSTSTQPTRLGKLLACLSVFHPVHFLKTLWSMRPILAATIILLIAAPWYVLVDARTDGDFTRLFFIGEHFGRATTAMENHSGGFWFYPLAILVGFFPWSVFWGPVVVGLIKNPLGTVRLNSSVGHPDKLLATAATTLMLCWIGVQVVAYSLAETKLPSYVTPCYPALAIMTAMCLVGFASDRTQVNRLWFAGAFGGLVVAGIGVTAGVGFATIKFLPNQTWLAGLGLIPLAGGILLLWMLFKNQKTAMPGVFAALSVLFCGGLFGLGTVSLDSEQHSHQIIRRIGPEDSIAAFGCLESSWVFYAERPIVELSVEPESTAPNPNDQSSEFWKPKPRVTVEEFIEANASPVLITTSEHLDSLKQRLPENFEVLQTTDYFLKNKQLLLLVRSRGKSGQPSNHVAGGRDSTDQRRR